MNENSEYMNFSFVILNRSGKGNRFSSDNRQNHMIKLWKIIPCLQVHETDKYGENYYSFSRYNSYDSMAAKIFLCYNAPASKSENHRKEVK